MGFHERAQGVRTWLAGGTRTFFLFFAVRARALVYLKHLINKQLWTDPKKHVLLTYNAARVLGAQALTNHVKYWNEGTRFLCFCFFFCVICLFLFFNHGGNGFLSGKYV